MRNAEASRERILEAAMAEFSTHGIAGARVDRIAKTAGCNKNLIYIYFESKENLFNTVLRKHLSGAYQHLPLDPTDLPDFAVRVFDFAMANPGLMRLMTWHNLEKKVDKLEERSVERSEKVALIARAQKAGHLDTALPAGFLMNAILALATAWSAANAVGLPDAEAEKRPATLRRNLAQAIRLLARTRKRT
jgi:AcrR family transcriptional regulator